MTRAVTPAQRTAGQRTPGQRTPAEARAVPRSRLRPADALRTAAASLRSRSWRTALSALGIAIGIGAGVAVLGVSASSRAALLAELGAEGNLLTVSAGQDVTGAPAPLPGTASGMIARIPPVQTVTAVGYVPGILVRRTAAVPAVDSGGISVLATQTSLLHTLGGQVARGVFLNAATIHYPAVVLGAIAARTLGITRVPPGTLVYLGGRYFSVVGILRPVPLAPEIDEAALVGFPVANAWLGLGGHATEIYLRAQPDQVQAVAAVLPFTANPALPEGVQVSLPSQVLAARAQAGSALTGLFLGPGRGRGGSRRDRHRQHHGDLRAGAPGRDRPAPGARRHAPPRGRPVPDRVGAAVGVRRPGRRPPGRGGHRRVRDQYRSGGGRPARGRRGRPGRGDRRRRRGRGLPGRARRPAPSGRGPALNGLTGAG